MLRPWIAIAVVACSHDDTVPAASHAGTVTDVAGKVTITHDGRAHDARTKDVVEADDVVATGADGHVTIVLANNDVPWQLGPGRSSKVRDSVAWDLPRRDPNAKPTDENTETAGRPAERMAADTDATKSTTAAPTEIRQEVARSDTAPAMAAKDDAKKPPEKTTAPHHVAPPPNIAGTSGGGGGSATDKGGNVQAQDAAQRDRAAIIAIKGTLAACFTGDRPQKLVVRIDHAHAVMRIAPIGVTADDATHACLAKALAAITFSSADQSLTIEL